MITRGYLIGEIIDSLSTISSQVNMRCKLGLTDLNKYSEDYFCKLLNMIMGTSLKNANDNRSNEPGIDLIDSNSKIAFQITSTATSAKVNKTLKAAKEHQNFNIFILIIGEKQTSYSLDESLTKRWNFNNDNILDLNDLAKNIIPLNISILDNIYKYIRKEFSKIKIDLEIPDSEGNYETSITNYIESSPKLKLGKTGTFIKFIFNGTDEDSINDIDNFKTDVYESIEKLANELIRLPRITREFYAFIIDRSEFDNYCLYRLIRTVGSETFGQRIGRRTLLPQGNLFLIIRTSSSINQALSA
jgi:uncharacterized protein YeeX (DUF496 family)